VRRRIWLNWLEREFLFTWAYQLAGVLLAQYAHYEATIQKPVGYVGCAGLVAIPAMSFALAAYSISKSKASQALCRRNLGVDAHLLV